jgi:PBP1b-binding outer membrane lipoprotein LpoB
MLGRGHALKATALIALAACLFTSCAEVQQSVQDNPKTATLPTSTRMAC